MKMSMILGLLALTACTNTTLGANVRFGGNGLSVSPQVNTNVGGLNVAVSG